MAFASGFLTDFAVLSLAMKGHFRKRGDKWYFWAEHGTDGDGKRQQVSFGASRTRREAEAAFATDRKSVV